MKTVLLTPEGKQRLDVLLASALEISRAAAQKLIAAGAVQTADGRSLTVPHEFLRDPLSVHVEEVVTAVVAPKPLPTLDILFENDDVLVVNKAAGVLVHAAPHNINPTLEDAFLAAYPTMRLAGLEEKRNGIVHRLDKEASGVLIAAKTEDAFQFLKTQFAERLTEKHYRVQVYGTVRDDAGTITFPIARSVTKARMAARAEGQDGKEAITHYDVVARYTTTTELAVRIETGRTHQIRAHMFALGHPVVGDTLYVRKEIKKIPLGRLFLHAAELTITLPDGERRTFTAPLPAELVSFQRTLRPLSTV
jgi:23S rRNA pseudouridine1911/1915/1917 synthase